jgi:predicted dehydrogenase
VNIGVLGLGKMGSFHLNKLRALFPSQPISTFDTNNELSSCKDLKQFLYEVDAAIIASPTPTHYAYAKAALEAGVHVLVEKPICEKTEEAEELIEISERNHLILAVGFIERFRLKYFLKEEALLFPLTLETHRESTQVGRDPSIDVIMDLLVHDIDLVLSVVKEDIVDISCAAKKEVTSVWDEVAVEIKFSKGSKAKLFASRIAKVLKRTFEVENKIKFDFTQAIAIDPLLEQTKNFVASIESKTQPLVTARDGLKSLEVVLKIQKKLASTAVTAEPHEIRL